MPLGPLLFRYLGQNLLAPYIATNTRDVADSGLPMVKRIVERHNGWLMLQSRLNQGTIATVELPYKAVSSGC